MPTASRTPSKGYRAARACLVASIVLSAVGYGIAMTLGDQTPPYEASAVNELAWTAFLLFGAASLVLSAIVLVWHERSANHRA